MHHVDCVDAEVYSIAACECFLDIPSPSTTSKRSGNSRRARLTLRDIIRTLNPASPKPRATGSPNRPVAPISKIRFTMRVPTVPQCPHCQREFVDCAGLVHCHGAAFVDPHGCIVGYPSLCRPTRCGMTKGTGCPFNFPQRRFGPTDPILCLQNPDKCCGFIYPGTLQSAYNDGNQRCLITQCVRCQRGHSS